MTVKLGINGYGRIGRNVLRALYEGGYRHDLQVVAVNNRGDAEANAHLLRYDTAHGRFAGEVAVENDELVVNGDRIQVLGERDPAKLPWKQLGVDVVIEATGAFNSESKASAHLDAGANKVLISAPAGDIPTIVYGVNHGCLTPDDRIVSNASCTTNGLVPLLRPLHEALGIEHGLMTTVHAYTNDQVLTDASHKDRRRARSATTNMIPTKTGAAASVGRVLPELDGRLDGFALRVPTLNVSLVDLTLQVARNTSVDAVNNALASAARGPLAGILAYSEDELVSTDFNHTTVSSTVDAPLTKVIGARLVKVCAWYDNEWGFSNRMLDTAAAMARVG